MSDNSKTETMPENVTQWQTPSGLWAVAVLRGYAHKQWWCGYVGVPKDHPLYGVKYNSPCPGVTWESLENTRVASRGVFSIVCGVLNMAQEKGPDVDFVFDVHGSITWSDRHINVGRTPEDGLWWFGFDCNHVGDTVYVQDKAYVIEQCESLARQLAKFAEVKHG